MVSLILKSSEEAMGRELTANRQGARGNGAVAVPRWALVLTGRRDGAGAWLVVGTCVAALVLEIVCFGLLAAGVKSPLVDVIGFGLIGLVVIAVPVFSKATFLHPNCWMLLCTCLLLPPFLSVLVRGENILFFPAALAVLGVLYVLSLAKVIGLGAKGRLTGLVIMAAQQRLREQGLLEAATPGFYDEATYLAIARFQRNQGLEQTGNLNRRTWSQLTA